MKLMEKFRHEAREARERSAERPLSTADLAHTDAAADKPAQRVERTEAATRVERAEAATRMPRAETTRPADPRVDVEWNAPRRPTEPAGKLNDQDVEDAVEVARREADAEARGENRAAAFADTQTPAAIDERAAGREPHARSHAAHAPVRHAAPEEQRLAPLFTAEVAQGFRSRWDTTQIGFVDDPRQAVQQADELVAQVMKSLAQSFADERRQLEAQMHDESASTENLRVALQRYRSFFQRLLSL